MNNCCLRIAEATGSLFRSPSPHTQAHLLKVVCSRRVAILQMVGMGGWMQQPKVLWVQI